MMLAKYDNNNKNDASLLQAHHYQRLLYYYPTNHTDAEWHEMIGEIFGACLGDRKYKNKSIGGTGPPLVNLKKTEMPSRPPPPPPPGLIRNLINGPLHIVISFVDRRGYDYVVVDEYNWHAGLVAFPYRLKKNRELNLRDVEINLNGYANTNKVRAVYEKLLDNAVNGRQYLAIKYNVENMTTRDFLNSLKEYFIIGKLVAITLGEIRAIFDGRLENRVDKMNFEKMTKQMFEQVILSEKPARLGLYTSSSVKPEHK